MVDQNRLLSFVLRAGIIASVALVGGGLILYFLGADSSAIINLGILVLIATPVLRVITATLTFAINRERKYVLFSLLVLIILLASFWLARL